MNVPPNLAKRVGLAAALFLVASLGSFEGRRHHVYYDIGGVPTVCDGITGEGVIPGQTYTDEECDAMIAERLDEMSSKTLACIHEPLTIHEVVAWVHFSYNVGVSQFCDSTAAKMLNAGDHNGACNQIGRWTWAAGKDCRLSASKCSGLVKRRNREQAMCEGQISVPGDPT